LLGDDEFGWIEMKKALTAFLIDNLKPQQAAYYIGDAKQDGLRIRVAPDGSCTWNVTVRIKGGKLLSTSLGRCDTEGRSGLDLSAARDRAAAIIKAARQGENLVAAERAIREVREKAITTSDLISAYSSDISNPNRKGGALRTAKEIQRRLERALAQKIREPAQDIMRRDISDVLDAVAIKFPREAEKRRQTIDVMFSWAVAKGYLAANPATGLPSYGSSALRDRVLSSDELKKLWLWLDSGADDMPRDVITVIKLQLLIGARVGEVAGIDVSEIWRDKQKLLWTLPAERSKNKKLHTRPLVGRARSIIEGLLEGNPEGGLFRVLDKSRSLRSDDIGLALNHRKRPIEHFTTHDLRRTVVSGLDELSVPLDTIAAVIGHRRGGAETRTLIRHYSRPNLDSRIEDALSRWDSHLTGLFTS
jgi:integrase